jgi:hypothetical protein
MASPPNRKGLQDMLASLAEGRKRLLEEMRRADGDKADAEQRHANLTKILSMMDSYRDELAAQLRALEAAEEGKAH